MARRKDAAQRASPAAGEDSSQLQEQSNAAAQPQAERGLRRRRQSRQQQPAEAAAAAAAEPAVADPVESMAWWQYYPWQYGGLVLGSLACYNTVALYDQEDPLMVHKILASLGLAMVGLCIHETRPFKRMTYADKAREQGIGMGTAIARSFGFS